ncbi:MAG: DNA polymerase Y family protein, partial [Planctomycetota bacterium]
VGDFVDLPPEGVERRFGKEARWLHALARGEIRPPLAPVIPEPPLRERAFFESGETEASRLAEAAREILGRLLARLAARGRVLAALEIDLGLEDRTHLVERLRPAAPTLDAARLGELIALRLGALELPDRVGGMEIRAEGRPAAAEQLELFSLPDPPPRDLDAADRALARIRAQFRDSAVVRARIEAAHLPEAQFVWEPLRGIPRSPARPRAGGGARGADGPRAPPGAAGGEPRRLVRRIYDPPLLLAPRPRHEPDGWIVRSLDQGSVIRLAGPYVVSSGWWREAAHREYHFAETAKGEILWLYYDRLRRRWFLQGRVE